MYDNAQSNKSTLSCNRTFENDLTDSQEELLANVCDRFFVIKLQSVSKPIFKLSRFVVENLSKPQWAQ